MAAQDTHEAAPEADAGGGQASRHRAADSAYAPTRFKWDRRLTALAVLPCFAAALVGIFAVAVLIHAGHAPLRGRVLAALVVLGIVLVAVIVAGCAWAAHMAQEPFTVLGEQVDGARRAEAVPAAPADSPAQPRISETEVYVHLSHRLQSLVHRQIDKIDGLEQMVEDPDLLGVLFEVDHLATRIRRHAENLAVLGGSLPRRQWTKPVSVMEVLRSAASETLGYARVQFFAPGAGDLNGYALADVVHLLAELVENATAFSRREAKVTMRAQSVAAGLAIEIDDRGLGLTPEEYARLNALLREPAGVDVHQLLREAHIGLYVVAQLALRHGIAVQLQQNITGGTQALVVLPKELLAGLQAPARESGPTVTPGAWSPGEATNADTLAHSSFAPATGPSAFAMGGALPAPRHAVDGQHLVASPGIREAPLPPLPSSAHPSDTGPQGHQPTPVSAHLAHPQARADAPEQADAERPLLPQRRPQEHLAPPLAGRPTSPDERVSDRGFTPGLMADFTAGRAESAAQHQSPQNPSDHHAPTQEGR